MLGLVIGDVHEDNVGMRVRSQIEASGGELLHIERVDNVFEILADVDYVVNASDEEAFGRTLIEGLAAGAVPVSFSGTGPAEIIERAGIGAILNSNDHIELAIKFAQLVSNQAERQRATLEGYSIADRHFGWPNVATSYYRAVERLPS